MEERSGIGVAVLAGEDVAEEVGVGLTDESTPRGVGVVVLTGDAAEEAGVGLPDDNACEAVGVGVTTVLPGGS